MNFRDYDPLVMRWTTVDPIKDGLNWYVYCGNDPVNFIDPTGHRAIIDDDEHGNPIYESASDMRERRKEQRERKERRERQRRRNTTASDAVLGITAAGTDIVANVLNVSVATVISSVIKASVFAYPLLITSDVQNSNITMAVSDNDNIMPTPEELEEEKKKRQEEVDNAENIHEPVPNMTPA